MPAALTHQAIMLLARDRLRDIYERLEMKMARGLLLTDLELRIRHLAKQAYFMMSEREEPKVPFQLPPERDWPDGLGAGVSRFAVMGSMGPDIPAFSAFLAPNQSWLFDTVHKGTPDGSREQVNARTTDLAIEIFKQSALALTSRPTGGTEAARQYQAALNQIRAYVLGHLCHIAGDVISHPFVADVEWHAPTRQNVKSIKAVNDELRKFSHHQTEGSLDARVAAGLFGRNGVRDGQSWSTWWPTVDEVPKELFEGIANALEQVYHARSGRPHGLSKFEESFKRYDAPTIDADFIRDGYRTFSKAGIGVIYGWGYGSWLGFLSIALLPLIATFPMAFALPRGNDLFETQASAEKERSVFEQLTSPMAMNFLTPLVYGGFAASLLSRGAESEITGGLLMSAFAGLFSFIFLATLPVDADPGGGFRWALLFALPAALGLVNFSWYVARSVEDSRRQFLMLLFSAPFLIAVAYNLLFFLFAEGFGEINEEAGQIGWGVLSAVLGVVALVLLFWGAYKAREARIPENPEPFPAERRHNVRLFDESSRYFLPNQQDPAAPPEAHYPTSVLPLLKLWWAGSGNLFLRPRRTHLEYVFALDGSIALVVPPPVTPMTVRQLAEYLEAQFRDVGGGPGVKCALVFEGDADVELPAGAVFADHGDVAEKDDDELTAGKQADAAAEFKQLGTENNDDAYVLYHAPKLARAVNFGTLGPVAFDPRDLGRVDGKGTLTSHGRRVTGIDTAFRFFLTPGDRIVAGGQERLVSLIEGDRSLTVNAPFTPDLTNAKFERLGSEREALDGYDFLSPPRSRRVFGNSLMDYAGDLGALLCMGATSHLLDTGDLHVENLADYAPAGGGALAPDVALAHRVFRNWDLDRRLVDEWRLLVHGGARVDAATAALPGATVLHQEGFVGTLRKWMNVVDRVTESAISDAPSADGGDEPTNHALSLAMAHLFDLTEPVAITRGVA